MNSSLLGTASAVLVASALLTGVSHADSSPTADPSPTATPTDSPTPTALPTVLPSPSPSPTPSPPPRPEPVNKTLLIGHSVRGTPLYAYRRNAINPKRRVLIIGNIHGDEPAGIRVARYLRDVRGGFQSNVEVWIILSINPDGTAAHLHQNANLVDLNRNFPYRWVRDYSEPRHSSGPSAASEPETKALASFDRTYRPRTEIIFHQPLRAVDLANSTPKASGIMSQASGLPLRNLGTRHGSNAGYLQQVVAGSIALTVEFADSVSSSVFSRVVSGTRRVANSR